MALSALGVVLGCAATPPRAAPPEFQPEPERPCAPMSFGSDSPPPVEPNTNPPPAVAEAPDPTVTDGDKYHVVLENERVRVLRYHDKPGDKTSPHHHTEFVLYALSSFRRRLISPDGTVRERDFSPGDVIWMPEQVHSGENIGNTDTDVIIVESKLAPAARAGGPLGAPEG